MKAFASSADLAEKEQTLEVLADGVYALTAEGDPNVGAVEGEDFLVCFEALATPVAARKWLARAREHTDKPVSDVDSGRLAEPFWYVDSPLTTSNPARPFAGRPPRGATPDAGPGVFLPDAPVVVDGVPGRLREFARDGFLLLAGPDLDGSWLRDAAASATPAPVRVLSLASIDVDGAVVESLGARPAEVWVVRPDAHIAAVLDGPTPGEVAAAVRRACGGPSGPGASAGN